MLFPALYRQRKTLFLCWLIACALLPLSPQENTQPTAETAPPAETPAGDEENPLTDDLLLMESAGLTVTATPETTQVMRTVTKDQIEKARAQDVPELLEKTLSLGVTRYGPYGNSAYINMRGFGPSRVAILEDGVPVNSPQSGEFDFSTLNINAIEEIEVIYGGSDIKHNISGAFGGVINIITTKNPKPGLRLGTGVSNLSFLPSEYYSFDGAKHSPEFKDAVDTQNINFFASHGGEKFSWTASAFANRAENHFTYLDKYSTTRRRENNAVHDTGASAALIWGLPQKAKLIAKTTAYYGDKSFPGPMFSRNAGKQKDINARQNLMLDAPRLGDDLALEATLGYSWTQMDYEDLLADSLHKLHTLTAINHWTWRIAPPQLKLKAGGDWRYNYLDSSSTGLRRKHEGGAYAALEYGPREDILLVPSVKIISNGTQAAPIPKFGLVWYAAENLTLKNNYFRSFKFPTLNQLYWTGASERGNPSLKPEDGIGADLTAEYRKKGVLRIDATAHAQSIKNSIHWRTQGGILQPLNIGRAAIFGWDTSLSSDFSERLTLTLTYNYLLTYILTGEMTRAADIRMPYMPLHSAGAAIELRWTRGSLLISGRYTGQRYADYSPAANTSPLDPHVLLDISVNQKTSESLTLFAALRNALNTSYVSWLDYPMPGASLLMGIKAVYE